MSTFIKILLFIAIVFFAAAGAVMLVFYVKYYSSTEIPQSVYESVEETEKMIERIRLEKSTRQPAEEMCACDAAELQYYCYYPVERSVSPVPFIVVQVPASCHCGLDVTDVTSLGLGPCIL